MMIIRGDDDYGGDWCRYLNEMGVKEDEEVKEGSLLTSIPL